MDRIHRVRQILPSLPSQYDLPSSQPSHSTPSGQPEYGSSDSGKGKKVIIEYSSPNIIKEFHLGHLTEHHRRRLGAFLTNLYNADGRLSR